MKDLAEALGEFQPVTWRTEILPLQRNRTLIRDCYNANPQSVAAALELLAAKGNGPKLALLADMMELGNSSEALHEQIRATALAELSISRLVFVGGFGRAFERGFVSAGGDDRALTLVPDKESAWRAVLPDIGAVRNNPGQGVSQDGDGNAGGPDIGGELGDALSLVRADSLQSDPV